MRKILNLKKILRDNPQVDQQLLRASATLVSELHRFGSVKPAPRRLASPIERKRAQVVRFSSLEL
jgi:hypothetical protein